MGKTRISIALVFLSLATIACFNFGGDADEVLPTSPPRPTAFVSDDGGFATVLLNNDTDQTICYVYISGVDSDTWGDDLLGDDQTIQPGTSLTFSVVPGDYDLMATNCEEAPLHEEYGITIPRSGYTWNVMDDSSVGVAAEMVTVTVINDTDESLCNVFFGPTADNLPNDLLDNTALRQGDIIDITNVPYGVYCTQAVTCGGEVFWEACDIEFFDGYRNAYWVDGVGGDIEVTNDAGIEICDVFFSLPTEETWGDDFLGSETLAIGEVLLFDVNAAGYYDILMQDCSGTEVFRDYGYIGPDTTLTVYQ